MMPPGEDRRKNPPTLTQEQLDLISFHTERAAAKALKSYVRRAVIGFLILLAGIGYAIHDQNVFTGQARESIVRSGKVVSVSGCNRDYQTISALRGVLTTAQAIQEKAFRAGDIPKSVLERSNAFYTSQLELLMLPDCRTAREILTDDPNAEIKVPEPLFPGKTGG